MLLTDKFGRAITDLRISITDRCNYKCVYCRTGNEGAFYGELPFADYLRMARVLVSLGIRKIRLTGGEPLLRNGVVEFVRELAKLRPQGLKPPSSQGRNGTAEAVPLQDKAVRFQDTGEAVPFQDTGKAVPFQDTGKAVPLHDTGRAMPFPDSSNSLRSGVTTASVEQLGALPPHSSD